MLSHFLCTGGSIHRTALPVPFAARPGLGKKVTLMAKSVLERASCPDIDPRQYRHLLPVSAQRRRRRRPPTSAVAGPSSGVLSLLATISAASSTVDGSPLSAQPTPPPFLCPYISHDDCKAYAELLLDPVAGTSASALSAPTPTLTRRGLVADKFVEGLDGRWRRADRYTLYGSTVCMNCDPTPPPADDAIQPSSIAIPPPATQSTEMFDNMPNGWKPQAKVDSPRVTLILTTSLVLAFFICAFMVAFIVWRRKKRRRLDEELRLQNRVVNEHQDLAGREARVKQKLWTRASARWKANVRSSARRRRNRRIAQTLSPQSSVASLNDIAFSVPVPRSSISPPRPSTELALEARHSISSDRSAAGHTMSVLAPTDPESPSPPAYIHSSSTTLNLSKLHSSREAYRIDIDAFESSSYIPHDDDEDHPEYTADDDPIPYDDSYNAGHVATDDKAALSRMAHMVSAPPIDPDDGGPSALVISAPVWHDEELEGAIDDTEHHDHSDLSAPPLGHPSTSSLHLYPPPPSKDKTATADFYGYPYSFEEDVGSLELEPSAPPSEGHNPSASPLENPDMLPSAPPLSSEEYFPSAPDWDWEDSERNEELEGTLQQQPSNSGSDPVTVARHLPSYHA